MNELKVSKVLRTRVDITANPPRPKVRLSVSRMLGFRVSYVARPPSYRLKLQIDNPLETRVERITHQGAMMTLRKV